MIASISTKMLIWTSGLALGLGAITLATLLEPPPGPSATFDSTSIGSTRAPASIAGTGFASTSSNESSPQQTFDLKTACSMNQATLSTTVRQLRLSGEGCGAKNPIIETYITNVTNGFSATVFPTSATSFTTDYISLAEGTNRLKIHHTYQDGHHDERELQIERDPASVR